MMSFNKGDLQEYIYQEDLFGYIIQDYKAETA